MNRLVRDLWLGIGFTALVASGHFGLASRAFAEAALPPPSLSDLAARFGAREFIRGMTMSPDGRRVAIVENLANGAEVLATADLDADAPPKQIMRSPGGDAHFDNCFWVTDNRLICRIHYTRDEGLNVLSYTRLFSLNADGSDLKMLTADTNDRSLYNLQNGGWVIDRNSGKPGSVLMARKFVPESTIGTHLANDAEGLAVEQVDVVSLSRTLIEVPRKDSAQFITDGVGHVRVRGDVASIDGYDKSYVDWFYRKAGSRDWRTLGRVNLVAGREVGFQPQAVDPALDAVYGFDDKDGTQALYRIKLDGSMAKELVLARGDVDIDEVMTIGQQNRVVGVSYATDRRQVAFFDEALKRLGNALIQSLPNHPELDFVDASADESKLLLLARSDTDPGMFYRFDKSTHKLEEILPVRPELKDMPLATMKPVTFTARDGSQVPAYLTLPVGSSGKGLAAIVMPHGGANARDELGFDWFAQFFAARGFAVLQPNYRGSGGYGAHWFQKNGFQSWKSAIGDVDDAGKWLVSTGIADPAKLAIAGWDYGGYAALQSGVIEPGLYKAIVAIGPVTDLASFVEAKRDFTNFGIVDDMVGHGPQVQEGSPAQNAEFIRAPVLMFHSTWNDEVPIDQSRLMLARLKRAGKVAELVEFPKLTYQIDDTAARTAMLTRIDGFLRQSMGM